MIKRVGYIGLGNMGRPIATNVLKGGFELIVHDLRDEVLKEFAAAGAQTGQSGRAVGEFAELIELSVVNDEQVESVIMGPDGVLSGAKPGSIIAIHSTIHPSTVQKVAARAKEQGVEVLDAQVSGGQTGARSQTLCYMVGGDKQAFERCRPVFATSGQHIFHMGELGMGSVTKIAQQIITTITMLAASEGMQVAGKAGVDLDTFEQLLAVTSAGSPIAQHWRERYGNMDLHMASLFYQGLEPAIQLGHELGLSLPGTALTQQLFPKILGLSE